ncbi:hypothetical protein QJQ45_013881, partial [Haematococcus lacustris]
KASTICDALTTGSVQFGFVHVKAVDDCGHDRRLQMKVMFQEVVDVMLGQMVRRLWQCEVAAGGTQRFALLVTGDHSTPVLFGDHSHEPVPLAIAHLAHVVEALGGSDYVEALPLEPIPLPDVEQPPSTAKLCRQVGRGVLPYARVQVVRGDPVRCFDELSAARGGLGRFPGSEVMPLVKAFLDAGEGTCSNPYRIASLPANATNQVFGLEFDTYGSIPNYNWDSLNLHDSADFTFMLVGDSPDPRYITVNTGVTESGECAPSSSRWDTVLVVFAQSPDICGVNSTVLSERPCPQSSLPGLPKQAWVTGNDDSRSVCGHPSSHVTFIAAPGQDYLIVVKGYTMEEASVHCLYIARTCWTNVSCLVVDAGEGTCSNPYRIASLPANANNQLFGWEYDTYGSIPNYNWDSLYLQDSADFTFMLVGDSPDPRYITVDTGVTESGGCASSGSLWDTELLVFAQSPNICGVNSTVLSEVGNPLPGLPKQAWVAYNDESSVCRRSSSRVTFIAAPGQDYLIVVKGYTMEETGAATIVINSTLAVIAPTPELGQCLNPVAIAGVLPGQSPSVWGAGASTCDMLTTSWFLSDNPDFTFKLLGDVDMEREVELDTCVAGQAAWDTEIRVYSDEPGICVDPQLQTQASACLARLEYNDDGSPCGRGRSRLSFTAAPGASYLIVVSGYGDSYRCGSAALAVTASFPETSESSSEESSEASAAATVRSRKLLHRA